ncbi:AraC family transcriptional regulator [Luteipulveratus sp. YIM 133132]|uniref:AraC family transcriptional regulator n=1 Tax=Luteipulveratus flavus TaxID=3031728 RepID=UPI0023B0A1F6|nr:AraC family transcriptional regulator [Luteipulveratus sp. YIM 133132]MDE9366629.1 AraC family transcriptional regulator [Luteipulveratus sp. YIM 133132]
MEPMIRAASLRGFVALVQQLGGDPDDLLRQFSIPRDVLLVDDGLISLTDRDRMLDAAAEILDCPDFGLRLADHQDLGVLGALAVAIEASATGADAVGCASRYMFVHSSALRVELRPDPQGAPDVVALTYTKDLSRSPYSAQAMELALGVFHRIALALIAGEPVRSVELAHAPLSAPRRYEQFFGGPVRFGTAVGALRVERDWLDAQFTGANTTVRRLAMEHLQRQPREPGGPVAAQVRAVLEGRMGSAPPRIADVARLMACAPRTVQRRLGQEGTTFERLMDDVRRGIAYRLVTGTDIPIGQIAAMAGFAEQSALTRAMRRWYGVGPRVLRRTGAGTQG